MASQCNAIRAGAGGIRHSGDFQNWAATGRGLRQRSAVPVRVSVPMSPAGASFADLGGKCQRQKGIVLPELLAGSWGKKPVGPIQGPDCVTWRRGAALSVRHGSSVLLHFGGEGHSALET